MVYHIIHVNERESRPCFSIYAVCPGRLLISGGNLDAVDAMYALSWKEEESKFKSKGKGKKE
jgi:hypothetical protein